MQESKRHHYTPVFYLRRWRGGDGKVNVIRNFGGRIARSRKAPKHLGFEQNLYSYHEDFDAADRAEIETKFFKPLDNAGARIVSMLIDGTPLERCDRILWAQFLTSMRVRAPHSVKKIKDEWQRALVVEMESAQSEYEQLRLNTDPDSAIDWIRVNRPGFIESFGVGQLPKIASIPKILQDVLSFEWHTVDFETSSLPLLTSDSPCVYTAGLDKENCVIALPLSPRSAFFAFRPNSDAQSGLMKAPGSCLAARLNENVVGQAVTRAYSQSKDDATDEFFQKCLSSSSPSE